jgi:hypothetical protein
MTSPISRFHGESLSTRAVVMTMLGAFVVGCYGGEESVSPSSVVVTERTSNALVLATLTSATGMYGGNCTTHADLDTWTLSIPSATTDLSVVKGNGACVLSMQSLTANGVVYTAATPVVLTGAYVPASATTFSGDGLSFHGNAYISPVDFSGNFGVYILYSDDARLATGSNTASYAVVKTTSVLATGVPAPDYSLDVSLLDVQTDNDKIVEPVTGGFAKLTGGATTGQNYIVLASLTNTTYAVIHAAFASPTPIASLVTGNIPASEFTLTGLDLSSPQTRYVIIANASEGVSSYQVFTITFNAPT